MRFVCALLFAVGCGGGSEDTTDSTGTTPTDTGTTPTTPTTPTTTPTVPVTRDGYEILPTIDLLTAEVLEDAHVPGAAIALVRDGQVVWASAYGVADTSTDRLVTLDSPFLVANASEAVTSAALMRVWETDAFELDDPVEPSLSFRVRNPNQPAPLTFRQLLAHTATIADDDALRASYYVEGDSPVALLDFLEGYLDPAGADYDVTHYAPWQPGTRYEYTRVGAALCGGLVESISGVPFDQYTSDNLFVPLGMTHTGWHLTDIDEAAAAVPHSWDGSRWNPLAPYGFADYPAGTLRSSVRDLGTFLGAFWAGGEGVLKPSTVVEMERVQDPLVDPDQALLWRWKDFGGDRLIGFEGTDLGAASLVYVRADGAGYVVLLNAAPTDWTSVDALEYVLLQTAAGWPPATSTGI